MSTGQQQYNERYEISFGRIDAHVRRFNGELAAATAAQTQPDRGKRLIAAYAATRPILVAVTVITLIPVTWRNVLRIFITTVDEVTASFKAGKDLAVGDGDATTQMEPKLPA